MDDTGGGIPDDAIARIFGPFFTTKETGMGMGLAICRSIIDAHEGTLEVAWLSLTGARFQLRMTVRVST